MTGEMCADGLFMPDADVAVTRIQSPASTAISPLSATQLANSSERCLETVRSAKHTTLSSCMRRSVSALPLLPSWRRYGSSSRMDTFTVPAFGAFHAMAEPPADAGESLIRPWMAERSVGRLWFA